MEQIQESGKRLLFLKNWVVADDKHARTVVDDMVESVKRTLRPGQEQMFNFKVVVNELINNELMHGSGKDVHVCVSVYTTKQVELCVYGTQEGFDLEEELKKRQDRQEAELYESGRGLVLAEALCESLRIEFTCSGSVVRARLNMGE